MKILLSLHRSFCFAIVLLGYDPSANALCVYSGNHFERAKVPNIKRSPPTKPTVANEFDQSTLVVRGTILSRQEIPIRDNDPNPNAKPGILYQIRVDQSFKGNAPRVLHDYSERDSSGFYLAVGTEYLLFLNPMTGDDWAKRVAPGALRVNNNCGQSRPWAKLSIEARMLLGDLANGGESK
jgi:hypothetical protein